MEHITVGKLKKIGGSAVTFIPISAFEQSYIAIAKNVRVDFYKPDNGEAQPHRAKLIIVVEGDIA